MELTDHDLQRIRETRDRRQTRRLLSALQHPGIADTRRSALMDALAALNDPRCVAPLSALLHDRSADTRLREAADVILANMLAPEPDDAERRRLWHSGDDVLRRHALRHMTQAQADLVEPVLSAPDHPLLEAGLDASGVEHPGLHRRRADRGRRPLHTRTSGASPTHHLSVVRLS